MNIHKKIEHFIVHHKLINHNDTVIIGLSGGPDSVFLLHMLMGLQKKYNLTLIAAHLNHEWRPESTQEEIICRSIAEKNNLTFVTAKLSELSSNITYNGSKEEYARKIRRCFFERVLQAQNADTIALGHHAQDQQETFFIRLIRGTSLTGLTAMNPINDRYIRPLLETDKTDILTWLHENNINYALDASNDSPQYLRNRIRSTVLPALKNCDNRFEANFLTTLHRLTATELFLEKLTIKTFTEISSQQNNTYILNITLLLNVDSILQHRIIIHWLILEKVPFPTTQSFFDEVLRFLGNPRGGTHHIHEKWILSKKQQQVFISKT